MDTLITIAVTDDDLAKGKIGNPREDAIALAAKRLFPDADICTCPATLVVRRTGQPDTWYSLPPEARALIVDVDRGAWDAVVPITFTATLTKFQPTGKYSGKILA